MLTKFNYTLISAIVLCLSGLMYGQTPETGAKPTVVIGDVTVIDASKILVTTKDGSVQANLTAKTEFKRVSAESPSLKTATPATSGDIGVGDRVAVTGVLAGDKKSLPARTVYLMTKSDISQRNTKEAEAWKTRGIAGRVTAVNPAANQLTIEVRGLTGSTSSVITPKDSAQFRRYAPDSVKFNEAVVSSIADVKVGDMLRALGDKSSDGASFAAEEVVTGAFQTVAGTVKSVDAAKNEVVITNLQTKKDVTVSLGGASLLKKFPAEMAERLAGIQSGGVRPPGAGGPPPQAGGQVPGAQGGGQGRGGAGGRSGGIDDMLDRFPNITAADLKVGDMIAVSSSKNDNADRINAIKLLAGVEPFIRMAQSSRGGRQGSRGQSVDGGFSIPGLDGIGLP
ncbi:MAG: hypothetical protein ABJA02_07275 [Acidobacteriota bacterium]